MMKTKLSITLKATLPALFFLLAAISTTAQRTWKGIGSATSNGGTDFNNPVNWTPRGVPTATDDVIIAFVNNGIINFSADASIRNLTLTVAGNNTLGTLNVSSSTLTVNGTTSADMLTSGNNQKQLSIGVSNGNSGTIVFVDDAIFGLSDEGDAVYLLGNTNSKLVFKSNLTLGTKAATLTGLEPGTVLFDGTGNQSYTANNNQYFCYFNDIIIGNSNSPVVSLNGATSVDPILGNLTINNSSIFDLNSKQFSGNSSGKSFLLNLLSTIKLPTSSNFPSGFTTVTLDSTSTVEFNGAAQTITLPTAVTVYGNLTLSGRGTKTLGGNISINRALDIGTGVTMALAENTATLKSNAQTTAFVRPVNGTITYGTNGAFVVERHLYAKKAWRLLATPVQASTLSITNSWREGSAGVTNLTSTGFGTQITGPATSIGMDQNTQRGSLKWFDQSINNYREITNTGDAIARSEGYYVFVRGDRAQTITGPGSVTNLRLRGKILTGTQPDFNISAGKFASVGNPYPSAIDMRNVSKTGGTVNGFITWNPNSAQQVYGVGGFETYIYNSGSNNYERVPFAAGPVKNFIQSGEAVFVQATGSNGKIIFEENDKVNGSKLESRTGEMVARTGIATPTLEMNLHSQNSDGSSFLADGFRMDFNSNYDNAIDNLDFRKVNNAVENLAIRNNNYNVIVERRKILSSTDTIFLSLSNTRVASYRFEIDPSVLGNLPLNAFLLDKFLQTETQVSLTAVTNIPFSITNDAASRVADRFMIIFRPVIIAAPLPFSFTEIVAKKNAANTNSINWRVINENNVVEYVVERSANAVSFRTIGSKNALVNNGNNASYNFMDGTPLEKGNFYRIKASMQNGTALYSDIVKVAGNNLTPAITIQLNPVQNKILNLSCENLQGTYTMNLVSKNGSIVFNKLIAVSSAFEIKNIALDGTIAAGIYELILIDSKNNKIVETLYIQ